MAANHVRSFCLFGVFHVPQANRARQNLDSLFGVHLQQWAREAGVLFPVLLGFTPAGRTSPHGVLRGREGAVTVLGG